MQPEVEAFEVAHAEHDEFILEDGRRIYDFVSTSFQASFGHSNTRIKSAIRDSFDLMPIASPKASFSLKHRVSKKLLDAMQLPNGKMFYTVSGAESVENALKMARQVTGRSMIAARRKSYHGATLGALSVTGDWRNDPHLTFDEHTLRIPEPEDDPALTETTRVIEAAGPDNFAAVIVETISGANGVSIPSTDWFTTLRQLCDRHGILLILDEVLSGFGRTGPAFAFQHYGLVPDFVCLSKAISGGYIPFGAVWTGRTVTDFYSDKALTCGLTSYAHPLGLAALDGVLETLSDASFSSNKVQLETSFAEQLNEIARLPQVQQVRQRGLLAAIFFDRPAPSWQQMFDAGLHLYSKENRIVIAPPLVSSVQRLTTAMSTFSRALSQFATTGQL